MSNTNYPKIERSILSLAARLLNGMKILADDEKQTVCSAQLFCSFSDKLMTLTGLADNAGSDLSNATIDKLRLYEKLGNSAIDQYGLIR